MRGTEIDSPDEFGKLAQAKQEHLTAWIRRVIRPAERVVHNGQTSYGLKHIYERDTGVYVTNGMFKGAMIACGYLPDDPQEQDPVYHIRRVHVDPATGRSIAPAPREVTDGCAGGLRSQ